MNFFDTHVSEKAITRAVRTLKSGWLSEGKAVREFEKKLAASCGLRNPVTVNSGTSALHLALVLAGVKPGDEVILPAQTFIATGTVILAQGARPVFADIQPETGNISPGSIEKKITRKTKAVIPVHWAGYPCDMDEISAVAGKKDITVIEDAAHTLGAVYKKRPIGSISRFTAFSFQAIKHLTTGDGGALCCLNKKDRERAEILRWFGIDRKKAPSILGERDWDVRETGYKYHMNDIAASIGLGNLGDLRKKLARRRKIAALYRKAFRGIPGLELLDYKDDRISSYWIFTMLVERRKDFILAMKKRGVPASVVHLRIDRNSVFGGMEKDLPGQEKFNRLQVSLPVHERLTDRDIRLIIKSVEKGW